MRRRTHTGRPALLIVAVAIAVIWAVLIGAAALARLVFRLGRLPSCGLVLAAYLVLCAAVISWFGWSRSGLLGVSGMALPLLAGLGLAALGPGQRPRR